MVRADDRVEIRRGQPHQLRCNSDAPGREAPVLLFAFVENDGSRVRLVPYFPAQRERRKCAASLGCWVAGEHMP